jgi:hypothetical protein
VWRNSSGAVWQQKKTANQQLTIVSWIYEQRFKGEEKKTFQNSKTARTGVSDRE